jgi:hypothetical protein
MDEHSTAGFTLIQQNYPVPSLPSYLRNVTLYGVFFQMWVGGGGGGGLKII